MERSELKIGCQTYTWEMLGSAWRGTANDLIDAISAGGYAGIEITATLIGDYGSHPREFARRLSDHGLALSAFGVGSASGYTEPDTLVSDLEVAKRWIDFIAHFPGATLSLGSATVHSAGGRDVKFATAAEFYNRAAEIGRQSGVPVAIHPSSHRGTLLFNRTDYDQIFLALDPEVGWVPDTGHMLRGGMELTETLKTYSDRIVYVHLKDVDARGEWAMYGEGICDTSAVLLALSSARRFNGWLIVEEESTEAGQDPGAAVSRNRETIRTLVGG